MPQKLTYFLSEKGAVLIVTFVGPLVRANALTLEECIQDVAKSPATIVILSFRDVPEVMDPSLTGTLARLQNTVRQRGALLRMSGIHPSLRIFMAEAGLLLMEEVCDNLSQALQVQAQTVISSPDPEAARPGPRSADS
ncbi:MAG: STAS domain-containing protein [Oligoflexia bacterium]|nr:STAS domain-containing protein [Oligoflexia bacterium]